MKIMIIATIFISTILMNLQIAFAEPHIQINSHVKYANGGFVSEEVVYYIVTDPQGHVLGYDPRTKQHYNEFDGGYGSEGIGDINTVVAGFIPVDGTYTIEVIGDGLMVFSIEMGIFRGNYTEGLSKLKVSGLTDTGLTSKFQMTYNSDPSKPAGSVIRVATPSSLKQDIALSRKIGWIDSDGIMMSLYKKAEAIEKSLERGSTGTAKNQLDALINEVNAQKGKHIKDEVIKILLEDTQYISEHL
ncbi:MAG: hypothetical protein A2X87_01775 [Deltaproteobacteria bacterium GWC2_42_51]|nr:MAG: hypothetical protein A2056_04790 [Deltaproteobacteria bacterium GWA2_42_85]OGP32939.1 MAG: hypothetical protein A2X87_01775 [Deltaproteobacteria bacterium GWC2_42_51]OGQ24276.1 MAG: hypothetical protein A3D29_03220 [Deltaproteobacteria bacterium RIFCSPHIGHO2_02_FULL_42_44]OGQ38039.1 MAG: hypothetical protein A3H47_06355 [Deltaproteobacteria bacterium RIFCSPLOWO2_02_FULL_42_39]OGQ65955.1 MAG: hypothetical protein A3F88_02390 [Deltaproteobacteria bacterium RIFCSPLOWO2_12_FULL_42_16]OGQ75